ncbi:MAG: hypothetical protein II886_10490 [Prevotella sp.]|nr:hypothetical protein [Prevotella sp.]
MRHGFLSIIPLMLHTVRPSLTDDMKAIALPFWIRKGYDGLTFFGHIITHTTDEAEALNACHTAAFGAKNHDTQAMKNHEMIHLYQARSTHDSWLCFYWKYFLYWLRALPYQRHLKNAGYLLNPFEMEAYAHMHDLDYLSRNPHGCTEWKTYAAMPLTARLRTIQKKGAGGNASYLCGGTNGMADGARSGRGRGAKRQQAGRNTAADGSETPSGQ